MLTKNASSLKIREFFNLCMFYSLFRIQVYLGVKMILLIEVSKICKQLIIQSPSVRDRDIKYFRKKVTDSKIFSRSSLTDPVSSVLQMLRPSNPPRYSLFHLSEFLTILKDYN